MQDQPIRVKDAPEIFGRESGLTERALKATWEFPITDGHSSFLALEPTVEIFATFLFEK